MDRFKAYLYTFILFICCSAVAIVGMQFGDFWAVVSTGVGVTLFCVGTCFLIAKAGHLTKGTRGWIWNRFMFGVFAAMGFVMIGFTVFTLVSVV